MGSNVKRKAASARSAQAASRSHGAKRSRLRGVAAPSQYKRVQQVLSTQIDLDLAQISSRSLVPPTEVVRLLVGMESKGDVEVVRIDDGDVRYKLPKAKSKVSKTVRLASGGK